ncbi:MAG: AMP-binding protein [bacterium]|nr:AMP-binding protein [bacterium]
MTKDQFDWMPTKTHLQDSRIGSFMQKHGIADFRKLIEKSNADVSWFWTAALEDLGFEWHTPYHALFDDSLGMPWVKWFLGGRLNIVHHCLDRHLRDGKSKKDALVWEGEDGLIRKITYGELAHLVEKISAAMTSVGVAKGDVVAMCMDLTIEAVAVMFASFKIGATCLQTGTWHAPAELAETLRRGAPKMLFIHESLRRGGEEKSLQAAIESIGSDSTLPVTVVVVPRIGASKEERESVSGPSGGRINKFGILLASAENKPAVKTLALDAETPSLILFSSGTTGRPKAIVHTHGGALAQVVKEVGYAFDCRENDVFCWTTNLGWMMAPWEIIGTMFFGATLVLIEGSCAYPTPHRIFEIIQRQRISILGTTPGHLQKLRDCSEQYGRHDLSSLRILGSTGKVLDAELWSWFFTTFGDKKLPIVNIFGGTEVLGCLGSALPIMPLKAGTVGMAALGTGSDVCDDGGNSVRGQAGDVVCRSPIPSMTRSFFGDPQGYLDAYFSHGTHLWWHGDRAIIDEDGLWFHLGRSDDLIIRDGVKHDPVKIESALKAFPGPPRIRDVAAISTTDKNGHDRIVCFVVIDGAFVENVKEFLHDVRAHTKITYGALGQPDEVYVVRELPVNQANKVPHKALRLMLEGKDVGEVALQNPWALEEIRRALNC